MRAKIEVVTQRTNFSGAAVELALNLLKVEVFGLSPKEANVRCPFHNDTGKPNLYINVQHKPGVFHCFAGGCHETGTFERYIMAVTGWTRIRAMHLIKKCQKAVSLEPEPGEVLQELSIPQSVEDALAPFAFRHEYLYERGLSEDTLQRFDIGFDREENAITFPWFDRNGKLVTIKRRNVVTKFYSYPEGVDLRHTLFGLHLVKPRMYVWVAEGEIDAMYLDQVFRLAHLANHCAVALGGTTLHEPAVRELCKRMPRAVVLCLDNDEAGRTAQERALKTIVGSVKVREAIYPDTDPKMKDPNELKFEHIVQMALDIERLDNARIQTG